MSCTFISLALGSGTYYESPQCLPGLETDKWDQMKVAYDKLPFERRQIAKLLKGGCGWGSMNYYVCEHTYPTSQCPPIALISTAAIIVYLGWFGSLAHLFLMAIFTRNGRTQHLAIVRTLNIKCKVRCRCTVSASRRDLYVRCGVRSRRLVETHSHTYFMDKTIIL